MPTVIQHRNTFASSVTTVSLAYASNNTAGNLLGYCSGMGLGSTAPNAPTDSNSNTIVNATDITGTGGSGSSRIDFVQGCNSGANTVTFTSGTACDLHIHLWEISGLATSGQPRDSGTVASSATASVSTSGSAAVSGDAILAFFMDRSNNDPLVAGSGYSPSELSNDVADGSAGLSEYAAVSSGGTQTATASGNGTNLLSQSIVVFAASAGPSFVPDEDLWRIPTPVNPDTCITVF